MRGSSAFFITLLILSACGNDDPDVPAVPVDITYTESAEDFPNPERGFYRYSETKASSYSPLSESTLKAYRNPHNSSSANYTIVSTLIFRYFILDQFTNSTLSASFIESVKNDFVVARKSGVKLIMRFTYTVNAKAGTCSEEFICAPYGDAPPSIVIQQINQLKPVLTENVDVIAAVQLGFIGTWGEGYYTDYFGDASSNGQSKLLDQNWQDRNDVLKALLDATSQETMIQVRYPQAKQRYIYGIKAFTSSAAMTEAEAFLGTHKARIGFHNDCFLASSDDFGTYEDYGNSTTPRTTANFTLREYFANDSKFVVVGGETCSDGYSPNNDCEPAGKAETEMRTLHYTYLNTDYNNQVNNDWQTSGCMDKIKKNLGYRLILKTASIPPSVNSKDSLNLTLKLENTGFAAPYSKRSVQLVLRNKATNKIVTKEITTEIRKWYGAVELKVKTIADLEAGEWDLFLNLPDQHTSIATNAAYSIRLANEGTWEEATGYNSLKHTLTVK